MATSARRGWGIQQHNKKRAAKWGKSAMVDKRKTVERNKHGVTEDTVSWLDVQTD